MRERAQCNAIIQLSDLRQLTVAHREIDTEIGHAGLQRSRAQCVDQCIQEFPINHVGNRPTIILFV